MSTPNIHFIHVQSDTTLLEDQIVSTNVQIGLKHGMDKGCQGDYWLQFIRRLKKISLTRKQNPDKYDARKTYTTHRQPLYQQWNLIITSLIIIIITMLICL